MGWPDRAGLARGFRVQAQPRMAGGFLSVRRVGWKLSDPPDLPSEIDAARIENTGANQLSEGLDVRSGRVAGIDQEIAVLIGDLRATDPQSPAACSIDQLPGRPPIGRAWRIGIGKRAARCLVPDRLGRCPTGLMGSDLSAKGSRFGLARSAKGNVGDDEIEGQLAVAVSETEVLGR